MSLQKHASPRMSGLTIKDACFLFLFLLAVFFVGQHKVFADTNSSTTSTTTATPKATAASVTVANDQSATNPYPSQGISGESSGDFVVGPGKFELQLKPGQSKTVTMTIGNRTGYTKVFHISVEDAEGSMDPTQPVVLLGSDHGPYTVKDYIHIPQKVFTLKNMQLARVPITVSLPADAEPGGRYGSVLVSITSAKTQQDGTDGAAPAAAVVSRIGTLFFVTTPGDTNVHAKMTSFYTIPKRPFFFQGPINFGLEFQNTGSLHVDPYGTISIKNMAGNEVANLEITPWFSLPQSLRTREVSWDRNYLFGRYTATVTLHRGYGDKVDTKTIAFWVIPWKPLVAIFVGLFLFILLIRFIAANFEFRRK